MSHTYPHPLSTISYQFVTPKVSALSLLAVLIFAPDTQSLALSLSAWAHAGNAGSCVFGILRGRPRSAAVLTHLALVSPPLSMLMFVVGPNSAFTRSVVLLAPTSHPHSPCGTGFFVSGPTGATFLFTAAHVAAHSPLVAICNPPTGPTHSMLLPLIWFTHPQADVAILSLPLWPHLDLSPLPFAYLSDCDFRPPQPLYSLSEELPPYADCSLLRLSPMPHPGCLYGRTTGSLQLNPTTPAVQTSPAYVAALDSLPGQSGAPVFVAGSPHPLLLGLLIGRTQWADDLSLAVIVPAARAREALLAARL
jgi:hypothetical protein